MNNAAKGCAGRAALEFDAIGLSLATVLGYGTTGSQDEQHKQEAAADER